MRASCVKRHKGTLRRSGTVLLLAGLHVMLVSCNATPTAQEQLPPPKETVLFSAPQDDLASIKYEPSFEPDYNRLTAQPWVEPVTQAQQDAVDVYPDRLEFPEAMTEVLGWEPGRLVVGAPSQGQGKNAMGFARRVVSVAQVAPRIVVKTSTVAIEDVLQGEMQLQLKPEEAKPLDLSKIDLTWAANNLYFNATAPIAMPGEPLVDDSPLDATQLGFFSKITKAVGSAAKAVAKVAKDVYLAVTPDTVSGSVKLNKNLEYEKTDDLFKALDYSRSFFTKGGLPAALGIEGKGEYGVGLEFNPGLQVGAKLALPGHNATSQFWLNLDSKMKVKLSMDVNLEASLISAEGVGGAPLKSKLSKPSPFTEDVLSSLRDNLLGKPDDKPAGGWKKTLFVSQPQYQAFAVGPVPVVITETFQLDLECGFEAKASIKSNISLEQNVAFKFKVNFDKGTGKVTITEGPTFGAARRFDVQVTGAGGLEVSCGLIPRVNVYLYDNIGLNAGVRASLVGKGEYKSECPDDTQEWRPNAKVTLGVFANVGLQAGARVQLPGSSYAGAPGRIVGFDFGPLEVYSKEFKLLEKEWEFEKGGLGYCKSICQKSECGGTCRRCKLGEMCERNTDCADSVCNGGVCSTNKCGDTVSDAQETDVDCGGPVAECAARCATGKKCEVGDDCVTGYCGAEGTPIANTCTTEHCKDGVRDADEGGIDCGGASCGKCANGVKVTAASHCASGLWNGAACVGAICDDNIKSGDETGPDCGGPTCARRCGFQQGCADNADCSGSAPACDATRKVCLRTAGMACAAPTDCASGMCTSGKCAASPSAASLSGIWLSPGTDNWAVGENGTITRFVGGTGRWTPQTSGSTANLYTVWGTGTNDIWAAGAGGTILHWDGAAWTPRMSDYTGTLWGMWGASANSVWALGDAGTIRYWNGTAWAPQASGVTTLLRNLWGLSSTSVWAVGQGGTILKWDGTSWTAQMSGTTQNIQSVWGVNASNVWAVGVGGTILKWNGAAWSPQTSGTTQALFGVWGTSINNVWAVGAAGTILKWDGSNWSAQSSGTTESLIDVEGKSALNIWAVGTAGTILRWDGSAWSKVQ